jgi:hypothetical protein
VEADVVFDKLSHEAIHGATCSGDELQHIPTFFLFGQGALDGFHLAANTSHAEDELFFFPQSVGHNVY